MTQQTERITQSTVKLIKAIPNEGLKRAILSDTDEEGRSVLELASSHLEVLRALDNFISARCQYGEEKAVSLKKGEFMQTSSHYAEYNKLKGKEPQQGGHPYQFHIFRESLFQKYYFHIFLALILLLPI